MKYQLKLLSRRFYSEKSSKEEFGLYLILNKDQIIKYYFSHEDLKSILSEILTKHIQKNKDKDFKIKIHRDFFNQEKYEEKNVWMKYKLIYFKSEIEKLKESFCLFHKGEIIDLFQNKCLGDVIIDVMIRHLKKEKHKSFYLHIPKTSFISLARQDS